MALSREGLETVTFEFQMNGIESGRSCDCWSWVVSERYWARKVLWLWHLRFKGLRTDIWFGPFLRPNHHENLAHFGPREVCDKIAPPTSIWILKRMQKVLITTVFCHLRDSGLTFDVDLFRNLITTKVWLILGPEKLEAKSLRWRVSGFLSEHRKC